MASITKTSEGGPPHGGLTDEQLLMIGRIAVSHSYVEMSAMMILSRLVHADLSLGMALFAGESLGQLIERTRRLLDMTDVDVAPDDETKTALGEWVSNVSELKDERNRVLHAVWLSGVARGPVRVNFRRGRTSVDLLTDEYLRILAEGFAQLSAQGSDLFARLAGERAIDVDDPGIPD